MKIILLLLGLSLTSLVTLAGWKNGFDLTGSAVPEKEIQLLGPPREAIPPLDTPPFIKASEAAVYLDEVSPDDFVLGVVFGDDQAKAYPLKILSRHQIVNDNLDGEPVVISYDPLTGSGIAFSSRVSADKKLLFGASGLLYKSNLLLYDRETDSLWSQLKGEAISGPLKGATFRMLPISHTTWADWLQQHPDTLIMAPDTGLPYAYDPYRAYQNTEPLWFEVKPANPSYANKAWVLGVVLDGQAKAYPLQAFDQESGEIEDEIAGVAVKVSWSKNNRKSFIYDRQGNEIPSVLSFWFAWYAFHPDTQVYKPQSKQPEDDTPKIEQ